jgi:hypothetical protein
MSSQTLDEMISTLLAEEKRLNAWDTEGDSQTEIALFSKRRMGKRKAGKSEVECYYCRKFGHTTWNCKNHASDLLKGKLKESTNIAIDEYPSDSR